MKRAKEEKEEMAEFFKEGGIISRLLGTREQKIEFLYTLIVFVITAVVFIIYRYHLLNSFLAFMISSIMLGTRVVAYIVSKWDSPVWETKGKRYKALFIIQYIFIFWGIVMMFNLIYDFRFWFLLGVADRWIVEITISFNSILAILIFLGVYLVYLQYKTLDVEEFSIRGKEVSRSVKTFQIFMYILSLIVVPAILMISFMRFYEEIDITIYGGVLQNTYYTGQGIDDWFAYVFYILFQAPVPSFMIAFMVLATVGVIMAQNLAGAGRVISGMAMAIVAIVPLLITFTVLTGGIPPPQELVDVIGLSPSIASFIYGLGIIITYIVSVSIMGVFIASSRALMMDFA